MTTDRSSAADLASGWFGAGLSPHAVTRLRDAAVARDYAVGAAVMREGDETYPLGIVTSGRVALRLLVPEQGPVTILTVEPGDVIGWSALVPPHRATSTVIAVEPTHVIEFEARTLRGVLREDHALAATVYPRVLEAMARRLGATRHQLLDLYASDDRRLP